MRRALVVVVLVGCSSNESYSADAPRDAGADSTTATPDARTDTSTPPLDSARVDTGTFDAAEDAAHCCPIGERGCCMRVGGSRANNPGCYEICDMIPTDFEVHIDDAGCPFWYDPPGGTTTCNPGGPPDTGATPD